MATRPHATSEEQVAALGNIRRIPRQMDLLTGNLAPKKVRTPRGDDHIHLKPIEGEKPVIPGMAHFAGTGPEGKRCSQCTHCRDISVWGRDFTTPQAAGAKDDAPPKRVERDACSKAAELYDGHAQKGGIMHNAACKYFKAR